MGKEVAVIETKGALMKLFEGMKDSIVAALPKHITPERVLKMALVAASRNPKLYDCSRESWMQVLIRSSELGLDCSGTLGYAYVIPFWNSDKKELEAIFMPGYKGLTELALRGGKVVDICAYPVYKSDKFKYELGTHPRINHIPDLNSGNKDEDIIAVYAIATLPADVKKIEIMSRKQVDGIKARSKSADRGPWVTDYAQMVRKTVIRRICNYLPLSPELKMALKYDDEATGFQEIITKTIDAQADGIEETKRMIVEKKEPVEAVKPDKAEKPTEKKKPSDRISGEDKTEILTYLHNKVITDKEFAKILGEVGYEHLPEVKAKDLKSLWEALKQFVEDRV